MGGLAWAFLRVFECIYICKGVIYIINEVHYHKNQYILSSFQVNMTEMHWISYSNVSDYHVFGKIYKTIVMILLHDCMMPRGPPRYFRLFVSQGVAL